MKALITGINGFVGRYLADYLKSQKIEVWGTVNNNCDVSFIAEDKIRLLDIRDADIVKSVIKEIKPDYIFHLAAQSSAANSWKNPQLTIDVNITGTINLLEAIRDIKLDSKILLIGSSEEYGFVDSIDIPISESQPYRPGNIYAISKISQTMIGQLYAKVYNMKIFIVRSFNHIGPGQSPIFVVSDFAKKIAEIENGLSEPIIKVGNLEAVRDFTDVRDVVKAYLLTIEKGVPGEVYNVGFGKGHKIEWILLELLKQTKIKIQVEQDQAKIRPSDIPIIECDNRKIKQLTGWYPEISPHETLVDVLNFWRKKINSID